MSREITPQSHAQTTEAYIKEVARHANAAAELTQDDGFMAIIAATKRNGDPEIAEQAGKGDRVGYPKTVFETILKAPRKGESLEARGELIAKLNESTKVIVAEHQDEILAAAKTLGMRRTGANEDYSTIDPERAVFVIEGGANKTSIVRRSVMETGLKSVYGDAAIQKTMHQYGGARKISPTRQDGTLNPEHGVIRGVAGDFLPTGEFTESDANLATALADGYEIDYIVDSNTRLPELPQVLEGSYGLAPAIGRAILLTHPDGARPALIQIRPTGIGLEGGFAATAALIDLNNKQLVIATNGQYRSTDRAQAFEWAKSRRLNMDPAVALGDEPGDVTMFAGQEITTPARPASAYVNEIALYGQQSALLYMRQHPGSYNYPGSVTIGDERFQEVVEPDGNSWTLSSGSLSYFGPNDPVGYHPE